MGTNIKPEITIKNKYYIPKHRYYELLHFCRQYGDFKKEYKKLETEGIKALDYSEEYNNKNTSDITADLAIKLSGLANKIDLIEKAAYESDPELNNYIIMAVTKGTSFVNLSTAYNIPCGKNTFFDRYRKFFWLLNKYKD